MKEYLDLLKRIKSEGRLKPAARHNLPETYSISNGSISMDLNNGFPLLTTKKMFWKGIVHELLWFLRGDTNIKYLVDNGVNIWNEDAYRWYSKWWEFNKNELEYLEVTKLSNIEEFIGKIKDGDLAERQWGVGSQGDEKYKLGDLGKVYGYQWRNQNGIDQVKEVLKSLATDPYSRYHIIDGWNKADFSKMALPPCHLLYQFICRPLSIEERIIIAEKTYPDILMIWDEYHLDKESIPKIALDLNLYQRSSDTFLGCPFNIASMSLLLMLFAKVNKMQYGVANWIGGDTHLYRSHMEDISIVEEQLSRTPYKLPTLKINKELNGLDDILELTIDDFELVGYQSHPAIKAELFTGVKK